MKGRVGGEIEKNIKNKGSQIKRNKLVNKHFKTQYSYGKLHV